MQYERFLHRVWGKEKQVFLVDMKEDKRSSLFSSLAQKTLDTYIPTWKRILIIWGKKWLASGVMCQDCGYIPKCNHCDIPIAYHRDHAGQNFWICHICKTSYQPVSQCPTCQWYAMELFWTGLQKIESLLHEQFPTIKTFCIDAQTVGSLPKIANVLADISDVQCIIATSLLQVPPVWWTPDAVVVIRADSSLSIPDWKVSEHCYNLLDACIRNYTCPTIIEAYSIWHHAIVAACKQDPKLFRDEENTYRQEFVYPPYGEMALILYRHEIEETMFTRVNKLYQELLFLQEKLWFTGEIFATPPLVYKMYDKYRYNIVLKWQWVRSFLEKAYVDLGIRDRGFKVDWLPENIS